MVGEAARRHGSNIDSTSAILRSFRKYESNQHVISNDHKQLIEAHELTGLWEQCRGRQRRPDLGGSSAGM